MDHSKASRSARYRCDIQTPSTTNMPDRTRRATSCEATCARRTGQSPGTRKGAPEVSVTTLHPCSWLAGARHWPLPKADRRCEPGRPGALLVCKARLLIVQCVAKPGDVLPNGPRLSSKSNDGR